MHPYIQNELIQQRSADRMARAARAEQVRAARDAARAQRKQAANLAAREIPVPRIPDYVDDAITVIEEPSRAR
jgi:hypothetical protein